MPGRTKLTTREVLDIASEHLLTLRGHTFDLLEVTKPISPDAAVNLSKVISKLSPLLGNLIEFNTVEFLDDREEFQGLGKWERQDPGFPDTVFHGVMPTPGFEIKAWFPLATEITARFKDSQAHFRDENTEVCMLAWLPENIIYGKPYILDVVVVSGASVAKSRDDHYHNPPDYIVLEPEDTTSRTRNLRQTNTNGLKWQGPTVGEQWETAQRLVREMGVGRGTYSPTANYQTMLRQLVTRFTYRLDTNYAKMDRIVHPQLEAFKRRVGETVVRDMRLKDWDSLLRSTDRAQKALVKALDEEDEAAAARAEARRAAAETQLKQILQGRLQITEADPDQLLQ